MFVIIGIGLSGYAKTAWAPYFALTCLIVIFITRMISTIGTHYICTRCKRRNTLEFREVFYLGFQGNIKGAIPLAFIIKYESSITHREEAITSMILIVVATVLIYGSLMPLVAHLVLGEKEPKHQGKKIHIVSGRSFNQTPACEVANAFNYSSTPQQVALNNTNN